MLALSTKKGDLVSTENKTLKAVSFVIACSSVRGESRVTGKGKNIYEV